MDTNKQAYRQWMIGQIEAWEQEIARFRDAVQKLENNEHLEGHRQLWELDRRHRELFCNYEDLMLSGEKDWESRRIAVDAAASKVQDLLDRYTSKLN